MKIDLHTHSNRSDGTDSPAKLIAKAKAAGLDVVALTDHDSTVGWAEATAAARELGVGLVGGIEISTKLGHKSVHLLGYGFDPADGPLLAELDAVLRGRHDRLPKALAKLAALGYEVTAEDVAASSDNAESSGRPHIADAMIARGYVADRREAFDRFLATGGPAYVERYSADLFHAVELVVRAGGSAVVAHPWSRGSDQVLTEDVFAQLKEAGLAGIEVDHQDHPPAAREALAAIAKRLDLAVTGSSDYHGTGKVDFDLGCNLTAPDQLERLMAGRPLLTSTN